ncbi:hypothetical protein IQ241_20510 [Romeria aff. gracilis LEGE 07310]|uniref:Uncharacterized protein n=1 Tax=Vasconcelosia minhoensis LEGE 07310 TaxID=915328 RepID=A0A8J7AIC9_9CYAN|nr:hypothetical protein [Romeria gracilis]MBE9079646.1 hypothetical protein [Romeria aff. gracilis LEGE 07310]
MQFEHSNFVFSEIDIEQVKELIECAIADGDLFTKAEIEALSAIYFGQTKPDRENSVERPLQSSLIKGVPPYGKFLNTKPPNLEVQGI